MSPVTPAMTRALIVNASDSWCTIFRKLLQSYYLAFLLCRYMFAEGEEGGEITTESSVAQWGTDLCSMVECSEEEEETA